MKPMNWRDYITVDPEICHGRACISGTRVLVTTVPRQPRGGSESRRNHDKLSVDHPQVRPSGGVLYRRVGQGTGSVVG